MRRKIVKIDEAKCDGCGQCAEACAEGAIQIIEGKARLVSETYCDGLGDCLGECPQNAITIEEREAEAFDPNAVQQHLAEKPASPCPGTMSKRLGSLESRLTNWPVQLKLAPVSAPYFDGSPLLICADCAPFAFPDLHERFLAGKVLLVGCPKLDDAAFYQDKLVQIFSQNDIQSIEVLHMEVPCCFGLVHLVTEALKQAEKKIPLRITKIGIHGDVFEEE